MTQLTRRGVLTGAVAVSTIAAGHALDRTGRAPLAGKQVPGVYRYKIGEFEVTSFNDGFVESPQARRHGGQPAACGNREGARSGVHPEGRRARPVQSAAGEHRQEPRAVRCRLRRQRLADQGGLLANLRLPASIRRSIDTVIISHFHPDHISGLRAKGGAANFPNAEIMVPAGEWKYWNDSSEVDKTLPAWKGAFANVKRVFDPIAKDVKRFEFGKELVGGITSVDARGHSPGHSAFVIASGNAKLMYIADVTNHPAILRAQSRMAAVGRHDPGSRWQPAQAARHGGGRAHADRRLSLSVPGGRLYRQAGHRLRLRAGELAADAVRRATRGSTGAAAWRPFRLGLGHDPISPWAGPR